MKCNKCGFENDSSAKFCEKCGSALTRVCVSCGNPLKPSASFCANCGTPVTPSPKEERLADLQQAAPADLKEKMRAASAQIEGERKPVTILFTDIVGSTSLAEKLDPEEWKEVVSGAHQRVSQAVYRYEGTIAQLLGDGVLAFFGAPVTHEDDPIRAVRAALDIQADICQYANSLKGYIDGFQLRVGLNSGTVVVGNVGSDLHMEYLAIGDAVNLAARLQSAAQPGKILISDNTARLVAAAFDLEDKGEIAVKGKAEPVSVFEVLKAKAAPDSIRGFEELRSPLVGRENELALLRTALDNLLKGHGQIVTLLGEAGIGKNRLVEEARGGCTALHWIEGRALSYGQTLSFWSIIQLLYSDLGLSDGDAQVRVWTALKRRVKALFGGQADEVLPYLGHLLGVNLEPALAERIGQLDGETLRHQTMLSITQYFQRLAESTPTVMVLDDLHWADPSTLDALEQLLTVTDRVPLMLVLLSRAEREHGSWRVKLKAETDFAHRHTEIVLKPLSPPEQSRLVDNLLAVKDLPDSIRRLILEHAEGNPLYLEEIVRSLLEQGALVREGEALKAAVEIADITIPDTLQGVLLARIDRLQEDTRHTLQLASVIGKSFLYKLLQAIAEAEQQLDQHLSQLQRVDLVREKSRLPELEYMFKHSLTREAAYNSLLLDQRRKFHLRVGEALEKLFADRREQYLGLLAHHFEQAGEKRKAVDYLIQAGDQARLSDENTESIGYYQRAIALLVELDDPEGAVQAWLKLGLIYSANFQFEDAHQAYETAFDLQKRMPSRPNPDQKQYTLRYTEKERHLTLDPGKCLWAQDSLIINSLFSGLTKLTPELNVVPEVARSWQVLEEGRRYLFHLREDWFWTDGAPVTAQDFEWAWKRFLGPDFHSDMAKAGFDIVGAANYNLGTNSDPDSVGVKALDAYTLEVRLAEPVAYFPFITALTGALPVPRKVVETYGDNWWKPEHIVTNGPYRLVAFDAQRGGTLERNPGYPGAFPGNVQRLESQVIPQITDSIEAYNEDRIDIVDSGMRRIPETVPVKEIQSGPIFYTSCICLDPTSPPLDNLLVRKALAMSIDRQIVSKQFGVPVANGGLVPPGMPGHSPEISYPYDIENARQLLKAAGFAGGKDFPALKGVTANARFDILTFMSTEWQKNLGIDIVFGDIGPWNLSGWEKEHITSPLTISGWVADYPDPDNFLRNSVFISLLKYLGWQDAHFDRLVEEAARTPNRLKRMAMYRQADSLLVRDQVVLILLTYGTGAVNTLVKPWVKNFPWSPLGYVDFKYIVMEDH